MRLGSTLAVSAPSYQVAGAGRALFAGSMTEDDMSLVGTGRATMLTALAGQITHVSLHTADPGDSGTSEVSGGSYARVAASWGTATATSVTLASTTWTIPAGTPTHVGFWTALSGGTFIGSARLANPSARSAGSFTVPSTVVYLDAGDILVSQGALDDFRLVLHNAGLLQAPLRLDPDCVLVVDPTGFYDAEQRAVLNSSLVTSRTALAVGLGSAGCAGPIIASDKYGDCVWLNQVSTFGSVTATIPSGLSTTWTFTTKVRAPLVTPGWTRIATIQTGASQWCYIYLDGSGFIRVYPTGSGANSSSGATPQSLLGIASGAPFYVQIRPDATALSVFVSSDGLSWTAAGTATVTATTPHAGGLLYLGSFSTSAGISCVFYEASLRDGDESAVKVAEFTPGMFVGGNRANGDTAVDAYGVTWTIGRPAATTDMPRVMVGRSEQYISLPGVSGEYVSVPDSVANSITGDLAVAFKAPGGMQTRSGTETLICKWAASDFGWRIQANADTSIQFAHSADGTTALTWTSTLSAGYEYLGLTLDVDNGAGGHVKSLWGSDDGLNWSLIDSDVIAGTTSVFNSGQPVIIGGHNNGGTAPPLVDIGWVELLSGDLNGTLVERIDAGEANANATTWTSSTSGATVTLNKSTSAQYHATVVPANTTIVQGDGVNDFAQVCGDDTITDVDVSQGLSLIADVLIVNDSGFKRIMSSEIPTTTTGLSIQTWTDGNKSIVPRLYDGANGVTLGSAISNAWVANDRFSVVGAFKNGDYESFIDGESADTSTATSVADEPAGSPLRFFGAPGGAAFAYDLYGAAVVKRRLTDTSPPSEVQTIHTEGISA